MDKLLAIMYRDYVWLVRWRPNLLSELLIPAAYLVLFAAALSENMKGAEVGERGTSYLLFLVPGLIVLQTFNRFAANVISSSNDRRFGIFRVYMTTKMKPFHYVIGKAMLSIVLTLVQAVVIVGIGALLAHQTSFDRMQVTMLLLIIVFSAVFWTGLGIALGLTSSREDKRSVYTTSLTFPIMFSSSIFYDVSQAPRYIYWLSRANPLTYLADAARAAFFGTPVAAPQGLIAATILVVLALALALWKVRHTSLVAEDL